MSGLSNHVRRHIRTRVDRALVAYRAEPRVRDEAGYPFAQRPEDGSIADPTRTTVTDRPLGVRVRINARGAWFLEHGNAAGGPEIEAHMAIPLRNGAQPIRRRGKRAGKPGKITVIDGKPYLSVQRVDTYRGKHVLEQSLRRSFMGRR